jgi:retinol dehydrogenase-12
MATSLSGKTFVVTGATAGIGFEAAKAFAKEGARVIITARDQKKGDDTVETLKAAAGHDHVSVVLCDFASMASIRAATAAISAQCERVDVLLNNAGAVYSEHQRSADGLELTFATNHIGYFLFTHGLLPLLTKAAPARIVNVASDAHRFARGGVAFDDLERKRGYAGMSVYGETKLMNILFTRALAARLKDSGVTVNCLHPGVISSGFGQNNRGLLGFATRHLGKYILTTPEKGAATSIFLCTSPTVAGVTGKYFAKSREAKPERFALDDAAAARLWQVSEEVTGARYPNAPV